MEIIYYHKDIVKFIDKLDIKTRARTLRFIELLQNLGNKINYPYSKNISKNIFELRIDGEKQRLTSLHFDNI